MYSYSTSRVKEESLENSWVSTRIRKGSFHSQEDLCCRVLCYLDLMHERTWTAGDLSSSSAVASWKTLIVKQLKTADRSVNCSTGFDAKFFPEFSHGNFDVIDAADPFAI